MLSARLVRRDVHIYRINACDRGQHELQCLHGTQKAWPSNSIFYSIRSEVLNDVFGHVTWETGGYGHVIRPSPSLLTRVPHVALFTIATLMCRLCFSLAALTI